MLQNYVVDSLATSADVLKVPMHPGGRYEIEVSHRPSILDNVTGWQVFEDDKQIQKFLTLIGEFDGLTIDEENELLEGASPTQEPLQSLIVSPNEMPPDESGILVE